MKNEQVDAGQPKEIKEFLSSKSELQSVCNAEPDPPSAATTSSASSNAGCNSSNVASKQPQLDSYCAKNEVLTAEIVWIMKAINSHYSLSSCRDNKSIFTRMFPDSAIASKFSCGDTKTGYIALFGIAPYYKKQVIQEVKDQANYTLLFDESFNKDLKKQQLDVYVRIWDVNRVMTKYVTSAFLGHTRAVDMMEVIEPVIAECGYSKLLQLGMDGPNVNISFHKSMQSQIEQSTTRSILDIGTCTLHTMHNSFKDGCKKAGWNIDNFLLACYSLFKESPARRDDFTVITGSSTFPQ